MKKWFLWLLPVMFVIYGCGSVPLAELKRDDRKYAVHMPKKMEYKNFYLARPGDGRWFYEIYKAKPNSVTFLMFENSETYDFKAEAKFIKLSDNPKSKEAFKKMLSPLKKFDNTSKYEIIKKEIALEERQGQWCLVYYIKCWDKKPAHYPAARLMTILKGFIMKYPKKPVAFEAYYTETGLGEEVDKKDFKEDADAYLDSIIVTDDKGIHVN